MVRHRITRKKGKPRCIVIAGPNGAGKTMFAREYLPKEVRVLNFVNADLIASGLSPLRPELAAVAAVRLMLGELDRFVERRADFAWESTLSGLAHVKRLQTMKQLGYCLEIIHLCLASPQLALRRIAARVRQGGHNVPKGDVLRRFSRSWHNFETFYRPLANAWTVFDNSRQPPKLIERNSNGNPARAVQVERALLRAGESARRTAQMYGTPLYVWENGSVVAKRP
jgi:predicted ABC-type ATPase